MKPPLSQAAKPVFPNWIEWLRADPALAPGLRASYHRIVTEFLQYCAGREGAVSVVRSPLDELS